MARKKATKAILDEGQKLTKSKPEVKAKKVTKVSQEWRASSRNTISTTYPEELYDVFSDGTSKLATKRDAEGPEKNIDAMTPSEYGKYIFELSSLDSNNHLSSNNRRAKSGGMTFSNITNRGR